MTKKNKRLLKFFLIALVVVLCITGYLVFRHSRKQQNTLIKYSLLDYFYKDAFKARHIELAQRLDNELSRAEYFSLPGTDLELKIPASFSIKTNTLRQTPFTHTLISVTDYESDLLKKIVDCYNLKNWKKEIFKKIYCIQLLTPYTQKQLDSFEHIHTQHNVFIDRIDTSLTPQVWVLDNIAYQGKTLRSWLLEYPNETSKGVTREIKGFTYLVIQVACCAGYEMNYYLPYQDIQRKKILLKFGTNDFDGIYDLPNENNGNIVLDKILATLRIRE